MLWDTGPQEAEAAWPTSGCCRRVSTGQRGGRARVLLAVTGLLRERRGGMRRGKIIKKLILG
jgi:hypothetical protein